MPGEQLVERSPQSERVESEHPLFARWNHPGPKRLLALDGGGIRGIVSLGFLARIESLLRAEHGDDRLLCDHFDLIGGTSTGAIIAAALASGRDVAWIRAAYRELATKVFARRPVRGPIGWTRRRLEGLVVPKYGSDPLARHLEEMFDFTLGDEAVRTGLMIMIRRADTASPWPMHNIPTGKYYGDPDADPPDAWIPNRDLEVHRLVLASAAAPTYFAPRRLLVGTLPTGRPDEGLFVDGGVSPHNNPALQLLRLATLKGYGLGWPTGSKNLQLVSVGTGGMKLLGAPRMLAAHFAVECLQGLMGDCADEVELMLQWMSESPTARRLDGEILDLEGDLLGGRPLLDYLRYDIMLDPVWLRTRLGRELDSSRMNRLRRMDDPSNIALLEELGDEAAEKFIRPEHLRP